MNLTTLRRRLAERLALRRERAAIRRFHEIAYYRRLWNTTTWMGHTVLQYPNDLIVKQELIARVRPSLILELGTAFGGGALFYAHMLDLIGAGSVLTIDIEAREDRPAHPRIEYFTGSSVAPETVAHATARARASGGPVLVTLDSAHNAAHVSRELALYHGLVTPGSYLIVEDSEINGHPVFTDNPSDQGPGPFEAIQAFLPDHPEFRPDASCERYLVTHHPSGYLRRSEGDAPAG